jgi:hypothetical protein
MTFMEAKDNPQPWEDRPPREDDRNELVEDESPIPDPDETHPGRGDEPEAD